MRERSSSTENRRIFHNPLDGARAGINTIYQELDLVPDKTVAQNLFLGHAPARSPFVNIRKRDELATTAIRRVGGKFSPKAIVGSLSVSEPGSTTEIVHRCGVLPCRFCCWPRSGSPVAS
jgi:ABC-type sugar transport system ATPase subunit